MSTQDEHVQIRAALETLTRQVRDDWRQQLRTLRAAMDLQISSMEGALDEGDHTAALDAAVKDVSQATVARATQARQQAEATAAQALAAIEVELRARLSSENAANIMLRTTLEEAKKERESALNRAVRAEAAQRATAAQLEETLKNHTKLTAALDVARAQLNELQVQLRTTQGQADTHGSSLADAERQVQELAAERADLLQRLKDVTAAKAAVEAQCRQLEAVSQKLSSALSQIVREREPGRTASTDTTAQAASIGEKPASKPAPLKVAPASAAPTPVPAAVSAHKKPLQFSEMARDMKRVKIRRGIECSVDAIPGELVDLSIGGAQALLRQAVRPNQLVRLVLTTATDDIVCKGRVVWVVYEQPGTSLSVYRAGIKFADVDSTAVENFMADFCEKPPVQRQSSSGVA